jgi:hypothetical protein
MPWWVYLLLFAGAWPLAILYEEESVNWPGDTFEWRFAHAGGFFFAFCTLMLLIYDKVFAGHMSVWLFCVIAMLAWPVVILHEFICTCSPKQTSRERFRWKRVNIKGAVILAIALALFVLYQTTGYNPFPAV